LGTLELPGLLGHSIRTQAPWVCGLRYRGYRKGAACGEGGRRGGGDSLFPSDSTQRRFGKFVVEGKESVQIDLPGGGCCGPSCMLSEERTGSGVCERPED